MPEGQRTKGGLVPALLSAAVLLFSPPAMGGVEGSLAANRSGAELFRSGRFEEARLKFEEALDLDPAFEDARRNLAHTLASLAGRRFQKGDLEGARELAEEAVEMLPEEPAFHLLAGAVYFRSGDLYAARRAAEAALDLDEESGGAMELLGDIEYQDGSLNRAVADWEEALEAKGAVTGRLREKIGRATRELQAESAFEREVSAHFSLQHDGPVARPVSRAILNDLESLYDEIGGELGSYPRGDIPVIIYSQVLFTQITRNPLWVAGSFDGKIRIPSGGISSRGDVARLRPVLAHELTHAFLRSMAPRGLPLWFEEGLAKHFEGVPTETVLAYAGNHGLPLPSSLAGVESGLRGRGASVEASYLAALLAVRLIVEDEGFWTLRRIVESVGRGNSFESALVDEARTSVAELEEKWRSSLP